MAKPGAKGAGRDKTANVFNKVPKRVQKQAEQRIHEIWMAPGREGAKKAFNYLVGNRRRITFIELPKDHPKVRPPVYYTCPEAPELGASGFAE